jgi:nucleoside-diphosphate-sugar epimerase
MDGTDPRRALVFGASGLIGRWLVLELLDQGIDVVAAVRSEVSGTTLQQWLDEHRARGPAPLLLVDFERDDLGVDPADAALAEVTEVYNLAGAYRFGMTAEEARHANVDGARRVVELAARLGGLTRLVHLSGYRVGAHPGTAGAWDQERRAAAYARFGAYEASKLESDAVVRARAAELGVALTIVNPATVIGHSVTGESDQRVGLATSVLDLAAGRLTALPGNRSTFVPVVTVDYLATFMALLAPLPETAGQAYWVLDDATPPLPELLTLIGRHLGVRVPTLRVPIWLVRRLPARISRADPETLSFLSSDCYPTAPARELAERHGLTFPPVTEALTRWADHLVRPVGPVCDGRP